MRSAWLREELVGYRLAWCARITYAGRIFRMATLEVELDGEPYPPTMDPTSWRRKVSLFDGLDIPDDLGLSGWVEGDLVELARQGHRLRAARVEVFQVRVRESDGSTPDTYAGRRVLCAGVLRDATRGQVAGGRTFLSGSVHMPWPSSTATIPPAEYDISRRTWTRGAMADSDEGVCYPVIIGFPGRDDYDDVYQIPAMRAAWISRAQSTWQVLCVGWPRVDATTIRLFHTANPEGVDVNTSDEYSPYYGSGPGTPIPATDQRGVSVTVVDFKAEGYSDPGPTDIDSANWPTVDDAGDPNAEVYVGFTAAGGAGLLWRGEAIRGAGDVLAWALEQTGWPVDWGRVDAARELLNGFLIDAAITQRIKVVDWLQSHLLPLLPVTLRVGGSGIYPLVWRRPSPDVVARLDVDADPLLVVADHVTEDDTGLTTIHTLKYGYDRMRDRHRYTVRAGPEAIASTDRASGVILSQEGGSPGSGQYGRVYVTAVEAGITGTDISVVFTCTAGAISVTENTTTRVITVDAEDTVSTAEDIADAINATCTLVTALATNSLTTTGEFNGAPSQTVSLKIQDFGTAQHPACARSAAQQAEAAIVSTARRSDLETGIVYDHPTGRAIVDWRAEVYSQVRSRVVVRGPEATLCAVDLLDPVATTAEELGLDALGGWIEEIEEHSDGTIAVSAVSLG